ncbi:hypothetical protein JCGZ_24637 [Jatropha curcas]|uniref:Uncharacterized protein n=1 Tax=Jatropha curcas TaxID=180498 RepID=A0A067L085_JATCU|nr:hypothetical protein JCGZ_24637 [Jatropha curcas]
MDKLQMKNLLLVSRRSYAVATENKVLSVMREAEDLAEKKVKEKSFWMRDPKTGIWIPESHFGEVDVADLRDKFLNKKHKL